MLKNVKLIDKGQNIGLSIIYNDSLKTMDAIL
jgi:hypothetical protein